MVFKAVLNIIQIKPSEYKNLLLLSDLISHHDLVEGIVLQLDSMNPILAKISVLWT